MTIKEYRAKVFMEMMKAESGSALERAFKEEVEAIDRVIIGSKQHHEELVSTEFGYVVKK